MKYQRIAIRVNEEEKKHLTILAKKSGLSLSEYVRVRLFEEEMVDKFTKHERDMTVFNVLGYHLLGKVARKHLSEEEINEAKTKAKKILAEYNIQYG
jgi:hypothetical protein